MKSKKSPRFSLILVSTVTLAALAFSSCDRQRRPAATPTAAAKSAADLQKEKDAAAKKAEVDKAKAAAGGTGSNASASSTSTDGAKPTDLFHKALAELNDAYKKSHLRKMKLIAIGGQSDQEVDFEPIAAKDASKAFEAARYSPAQYASNADAMMQNYFLDVMGKQKKVDTNATEAKAIANAKADIAALVARVQGLKHGLETDRSVELDNAVRDAEGKRLQALLTGIEEARLDSLMEDWAKKSK